MNNEEKPMQEWVESYNKMGKAFNTNRIWDMAERLAETYYMTLPKPKKNKEELLEIFKYYLRELMKSET